MTRVSIVIPTYDTAEMTLGTCRSVAASMPEGSEIVVADDGSTDGTAELLARELPGVRLVRLATNRGYASAVNAGVSAATGEIILLLNSDAVPRSGAIARLRAALDDDPELGVAGAALFNEDGTAQWSGGPTPTLAWMIGVVSGAGRFAHLLRRRGGDASSRPVDWVSGAAMAIRRQAWVDAGPLDESFRFYCQDIEICARARAAGWRVGIVRDAEVVHGMGATAVGAGELRHDAGKLWCDLLDWGTRHYGATWGAFARAALVAVAWARIGARALTGPDPEADALRRAVRALASAGPR